MSTLTVGLQKGVIYATWIIEKDKTKYYKMFFEMEKAMMWVLENKQTVHMNTLDFNRSGMVSVKEGYKLVNSNNNEQKANNNWKENTPKEEVVLT